jgi:putative transcription factor
VFKIGVCEMCGSEDNLFKARIEGSILNVCKNCARYGKVISSIPDKRYIEKIVEKKAKIEKTKPLTEKEMIESVVEGFNEIIKKKREALNLKQEDFAKLINEKVSLVHKIETGAFVLSIPLARKIEKFLKVRLVEQTEGSVEVTEKVKADSFTLGDFIKVKNQ